MVKSSRKAWDNGIRIERAPHDPDAHVISTYYNHEQRERHNAARRRVMVQVTWEAKLLIFAVLVATVGAIFL